MNIWSYFSAFSLALITFFGIYVSESDQFELISSLKNPFEKAIHFQEAGSIEKDNYHDVFTKDGEFFRFYPKTSFNFEGNKREIESGEAFLSALFIDDYIFEINNSDTKKGFLKEKTIPKVGQITIGPAFIHFPGATIYVNRDLEKQKIEIYVFGHSVDLFFDGFQDPFVIPSGMKVEIYEQLISDKTSKLFYSKLKKEFRMNAYKLPSIEDKLSEKHIDRMAVALGWQNEWKRKMQNYAINLPKTWIRWRQDSFLGRFIKAFRFFQINFAVGVPENKKVEFEFQNFVEPMANANKNFLEGKTGQTRKELSAFKMIFLGKSWNNFLEKNAELKTKWDSFSRAQRAWLKTIFPDSIEKVFVEFWTSVTEKTSLDKIDGSIFSIENCIANNQFKKLDKEFFLLKKLLEKTEFISKDSVRITKMRRIFANISKNEFLFQNKEVFEIYSTFIEKEIPLYENLEMQQEIRLENGQDLLFFLGEFLGVKTDIEIANILLGNYQKLDISKIAKSMDRQIFTRKETEIIELIQLIGESGVNEKDLKTIRENLKYQEKFNNLISEFREEKEEINENENEHNENLIINTKDLNNFFLDLGINTDKMIFKTTRLPDLNLDKAQFLEGNFNGKKVSGIFKFQTQVFESVKIGTIKNESFNLQFFSKLLNNVKTETSNDEIPLETRNEIFISQTTIKAILKRELVREIFISKGFQLSRQDIKALNLELTKFEISKSFWKENNKVSFVYDYLEENIQDAKIKIGAATFGLSNQLIEVSEFGLKLDEKIKKESKTKN
jgi:hypothetical protein